MSRVWEIRSTTRQMLIAKTVGLVELLRRALGPMVDRIDAAFVYGSIAKGTESTSSDIDLLVVSDRVSYAEIFEAARPVESVLGRSVNPNVMSSQEWREKRREEDSFATRIAGQPRLFAVGAEDGIG